MAQEGRGYGRRSLFPQKRGERCERRLSQAAAPCFTARSPSRAERSGCPQSCKPPPQGNRDRKRVLDEATALPGSDADEAGERLSGI